MSLYIYNYIKIYIIVRKILIKHKNCYFTFIKGIVILHLLKENKNM